VLRLASLGVLLGVCNENEKRDNVSSCVSSSLVRSFGRQFISLHFTSFSLRSACLSACLSG